MPKRNDPASRERRRLAAVARSGQSVAVQEREVLSRDELAELNAAAAAEKASHPEGGGHADPELTEAGLVRLMHIPRMVKLNGRWTPNPDQRTCPARGLGCLECEADDLGQLEFNRRIFGAQAAIRDKRAHEAKRNGQAPPKRQPHKRPDVGRS